MKELTRVKFIELQGDIIALFPDIIESEDHFGRPFILSYQHIGQHSGASKSLLHCKTIKDGRIKDLWNELIQIGYSPIFHDITK